MRGASQGPRADARVPICGLLLIQGAGNRPLCTEFASLTRLLLKSSIWERQPSQQEKAIEEKSKSPGIRVCAVICCGMAFHEQPLEKMDPPACPGVPRIFRDSFIPSCFSAWRNYGIKG